MMKRSIIPIISLLFLISISCDKADQEKDFRDIFIGNYTGMMESTYGYLNPTDTSFWTSNTTRLYRNVLVTKGGCDNCIALIYDTLDIDDQTIFHSDTLEIEENGIFDDPDYKSYSYYIVKFSDDSLNIAYAWGGMSESYQYFFNGKKE
jgi:hypothetical protein